MVYSLVIVNRERRMKNEGVLINLGRWSEEEKAFGKESIIIGTESLVQ